MRRHVNRFRVWLAKKIYPHRHSRIHSRIDGGTHGVLEIDGVFFDWAEVDMSMERIYPWESPLIRWKIRTKQAEDAMPRS